MAEPTLFPNQPNIDEHVKANKVDKNKSGKENSENSPKLNEIATRIKILEERYVTLRKKSQLTEQNIIESDKTNFDEIRLLEDNILEVKHSIKEMVEKLSLLNDEISSFASKTEFKILERYVGFWQPMDFVTRKEVNNFLRKKIDNK